MTGQILVPSRGWRRCLVIVQDVFPTPNIVESVFE